ncbi:ABC transporter substrate-binding protein [Micromonospora polyrhachis]|uniref:Peptide/nickel transport system substrate-binding protein n=1 Tax=Micromonospora polyrhachis TaxID=1282883 RepID=A0A7W7SQ20_9ACTN|nr:ABC transporter substrate-binding protein [Micromonospora polyrhachis]MBB4958853.1 peptide/nickel transport system substrate-binding protein [Micromonospora polyrhachis]
MSTTHKRSGRRIGAPRRVRSLTMMATASALALGLAACSGGPASTNAVGGGDGKTSIEATLAFTLSSGFDPANASSAVATAVNQHISEGLVDLDPITRESYLALAKADPVASSDGLTYTVTLRDGAKFSDGTPVTAEDVAWSFTRVLKPADSAAPPLMQGFIPFIDSVTATDTTTTEFKLKYAFALFKERISVIKIVPKAKTGDAAAAKAFDTAPIGSGPFKLDSASKESGIKLSRNPNYNGPRPAKVDTMTWNTTSEAAARVSDLQGGRVQAIESVPYLNVDSLKGKYTVDVKQAFNQVFLMFNTEAKPFSDKRVRQALHYAIDKDAVIKTALNGYGSAATSYLDEGNKDYQKAATVYDHNIEKAKALLQEAGVTNLSFQLDTTDNSVVKDVAPLVIEQWKKIGVNATLNTVPSSAIYGDLVPKDTFRVLMATGDPSVFGTDTDLLMRWFYYGETWPGQRYRWSDTDRKAMAELLDKAAQTSDEAARKVLWKQALDLVADQVPLYPILHTKVVTAYDPAKVTGFSGAATTGLYFLGSSRSS